MMTLDEAKRKLSELVGNFDNDGSCMEAWDVVEIHLSQPQPVAQGEAVAWIEHHKGGDNLNWDRVDHPYARATPLYKHAVPNGHMMVSAEDVLREISHQASMCRNENPKFSLRLVEASDIFRAHMDAMQSNIDVTFATSTIPTGYRLVPVEPTEAMIADGCSMHICEQGDSWYKAWPLSECDCEAIYKAMLNAAPTGGG